MNKTRHASFFLLTASIVGFGSLLIQADNTGKTTTPVAKVGDTILTEDDLRKELGMSFYEAESQVYQLKKNWVDQKTKTLTFDRAAKEAGLSRQAWQAKEIEGKMAPLTQQEIDQWAPRFAVRGSTTPPTEADYAKMKEKAKQHLTEQRRVAQENAVYQQLAAKYPVELFFTQPETPQIDVTYGPNDPVKGSKSAPITIIEFTDFQCPYCKRSQDTLKQVEEAYGNKVKIVERQYPLPFHNRAKPAAEAVLCAQEQGKFWELHDKLFPSPTLEDADIQSFAKEVGLNEKKFNKCLSSDKMMARIDQDMAEGQRYGVRGTPYFFINGRPLNGAQPFDAFKTIIDQELAKKK